LPPDPVLLVQMSRVLHLAMIMAHAISTIALTLHVKAGPDGRTAGDCPFAHALQLMLTTKGVPFELAPHAPDAKPEWLVTDHEGKMPCLVREADGVVVTESRTIASWIDDNYPAPSMMGDDFAELDAAEAAAKPVFGAFARYCKSTSESQDEEDELKKNLLLSLCTLDAQLAKEASPYATGGRMSVCDCFLLPALYHVTHAGAAFKDFVVPPQFDSLHAYLEHGFATEAFLSTAPPPALVRWGWANARGDLTAAAKEAEAC